VLKTHPGEVIFLPVGSVLVEVGDLAELFREVVVEEKHKAHRRALLARTAVSTSGGVLFRAAFFWHRVL